MNQNEFAGRSNEAEEREAEHPLVWGLTALNRRRGFIVVVTLLVAMSAVVISLMTPNEFRATARVLPPEGGGTSPMAAMLSRGLPSGAAALLGGGRAEYSRYLAILSSRTVKEAVVDRFDLVQAYGLDKGRHPRERAIGELADRVEFDVDRTYRFLSISVVDTDPDRAADMANFFVEELNRRNAELSAQNASLFRRFAERRYGETLAAIDSVKNVAQEFQQRHGVFDVEAQARGFLEQAATLRSRVIELEIHYETLLAQYGPENPLVRAAEDAMRSANRRYAAAMSGGERVLPLAQESVPAVMREFMDIEQERITQARILELVAPLYEQARFDEEREMQAVQVIDLAVPPYRKVAPRRSIIVIAATISAFMVAMFFVVLTAYLRERGPLLARSMAGNGVVRRTERMPIS